MHGINNVKNSSDSVSYNNDIGYSIGCCVFGHSVA